MGLVDASRQSLRRMAWVCVALVLAITTLSAFMRLDKAGLGCEGWPQCYGQALASSPAAAEPAEPTPGIFVARLSHRVLAVGALLLIVAMVASCIGARPRRGGDLLQASALLLVTLLLALLGRWSARSHLPAISLGNLLGGFLLLALCVRLAAPGSIRAHGVLRAWVWTAAALVLLQTGLGGMVSATYSALSCSALPDCWSVAEAQSWAALDPWRVPTLADGAAANAAGAPVQLLHRVGAMAVLLCCLPLAVALRRRDTPAAALLLGCLAAQAMLGPLMSALGFPMALALLHNLLGAATLALVARWL